MNDLLIESVSVGFCDGSHKNVRVGEEIRYFSLCPWLTKMIHDDVIQTDIEGRNNKNNQRSVFKCEAYQISEITSIMSMHFLIEILFFLSLSIASTVAFAPLGAFPMIRNIKFLHLLEGEATDPELLMDMDIVLFSVKNNSDKKLLGAIQEDGTLSPLSCWTNECAFSNFIEFLVAEEDRWLDDMKLENVIIHRILDENMISYGSRQVGGGKGPGNPHGEESELIYYVDQDILEKEGIEVITKPELEIIW
jgi:hypothetical protein